MAGTQGTACQSVPVRETEWLRSIHKRPAGGRPYLSTGGQGLLHGAALLIGCALIGALDAGGFFHVLLAGLLLGPVLGDLAEFVVTDAEGEVGGSEAWALKQRHGQF